MTGTKQNLTTLLEEVISKNDEVRYNSFKILHQTSQSNPERLYSNWLFFENLLKSKNAYHKSIAVQILANLTRVDTEDKFKKIFNYFYSLMNDSIIVARNVVANSGKIAKFKPELENRITEKLLNIDTTNQKHKDLIKGDAIESFKIIFEHSKNQKAILNFVRDQLKCESPKTRKIAKKFLAKKLE